MREPQQPPRSDTEKQVMAWLKKHTRVSRDDIVQACTGSKSSALNYMSKLQGEGVLTICGKDGRKNIYTIHDDSDLFRMTAEKRTGLEAALWRSMRIMRVFSPPDLQTTLIGSGVAYEAPQIQAYCSLLVRARYLAVLRKAGKIHAAQYRLVNDTGPLPPIEKRMRVVVDENEDRIVYAGGERL